MKKIVIIVSVIVLSFLIIWFVISTIFSKTLTCIKENDGPLKNWYQEYSFTGYGRVVKSRERYSKIKDNDRHETIDKYYEMLKDDKEVYDIKIIDNTIEWHSKTSMVNYENLDNLGKFKCAVCPECGYTEIYIQDISKVKKLILKNKDK